MAEDCKHPNKGRASEAEPDGGRAMAEFCCDCREVLRTWHEPAPK